MNAYLYLILLVSVSGYTLSRGGVPEKIIAVLVVAASAASAVLLNLNQYVFGSKEVGVFVIDVILSVAVVMVALYAERFWPLWLSALLILSVLLQLAIWYAPHYYRVIYLILHALSAYPTLILLVVGTMRHRDRMIRHGLDPSWSPATQRSDPGVLGK